jgi:hypothetical protein
MGLQNGEPVPARIDVAVNVTMLDAIRQVMEREGVTLTEAVRRLIGYGQAVHEIGRRPGWSLLVRDGRGGEREIVVL